MLCDSKSNFIEFTLIYREFDEFHGCISDACTLHKINAVLMWY